ncbi:MAG: hypothetical protein HY726_14740 [Candidatus Rokubacteria bacterium]|nr:hypothetical protein [Candidatus Rokubacteria bacterium]
MFGTINKLGVLGTVVTTVMNAGCCAGAVVGPLAGLFFAGGYLYRVPADWQLPLLYGTLAVTFTGFGLAWRRHRRLAPVLLVLPGAVAILYPLHQALDVSTLKVLMWVGFGLLLAAAAWDTWLSLRARSCRPTLSRPEGSQ